MEFKRKGYYLRLLPAQCTLWDNVLIGRDPPTAEVMLSLLRKAEGGLEVGGWLRPSRFKEEEKKIKFLLHLFEPTCLQKITELIITRKGVHAAIITPIIT